MNAKVIAENLQQKYKMKEMCGEREKTFALVYFSSYLSFVIGECWV
jgi:hypothetical protein